MRRLLWPLGLVLAFGLGVAAGGWPGLGPFTAQEVARLRASESRLQSRVSTLEAWLRDGEGFSTGHEGAKGALAMPEGARPKRSLARATADGYASPGFLEPRGGSRIGTQGARTAPGDVGRGDASPASTANAALNRFYLYIDETNALGGLAHWQRMQQLADELRKMGPAGADVLLQVLEAGATSDERRAAAQLLGELQVQQALPLLQNIVEQDSDLPLRRAATAGLRRLQTPETIPVLEALLADPGEDRLIRMSAASGLAQMDRSQGVAGLMQVFENSSVDGSGRSLAFRALVSLNDERALPFMRRLVTSTAETPYRVQAMRFLRGQGDRQALPSLQQVMQSPAEPASIRDAAAQAHAAIAGR
jgi:HEAT repeat protein